MSSKSLAQLKKQWFAFVGSLLLLLSTAAHATTCSDLYAWVDQEIRHPGTVRPEGRLPLNPHDFTYMKLSAGDLAEIGTRFSEEMKGAEFSKQVRTQILLALTHAAEEKNPDISKLIIAKAFSSAGIDDPTAQKLSEAVSLRWSAYRTSAKPLGPSRAEISRIKAEADSALAATIKAHNIPHYEVATGAGEKIPVVLVNKETFPHLKKVFYDELPYAQGTKLFPNQGDTDHGVIRLLGHNMDWYFPGELGFSETHNSGLGWRELGALIDKSSGGNPIVEVAYALSPEEKRTAEFYHRVRRGNLFQVRNKWVPERASYDQHTAVLNRGSENCYMFGSGICTIEHSRNMTDYLGHMGVENVDKLLENPTTRAFLKEAEEQIMRLPIYEPAYINNAKAQETILHDWIIGQNPKYKAMMAAVIPKDVVSPEDHVRFFNYLIGIDSSRRYAAVMKDLDQLDLSAAVTDLNKREAYDRAVWPHLDAKRPRASAVFVYDTTPNAASTFGTKPYPGAWIQMPVGGLPEKKF